MTRDKYKQSRICWQMGSQCSCVVQLCRVDVGSSQDSGWRILTLYRSGTYRSYCCWCHLYHRLCSRYFTLLLIEKTYFTVEKRNLLSLVSVIELGGKDRRVMSAASMGVVIAFGEVILAIIAYCVPHWRRMLLVVYCPAIVFLSYPFLLKESLRWLLINGKSKKARDAAFNIARVNNVKLSEEVRTALEEGTVVCDKHSTSPVEQFSVKLLLSSGTLIKR